MISKKKPIIMSAPMILALNASRKRQTRRTVGLEDVPLTARVVGYESRNGTFGVLFELTNGERLLAACTYGGPGATLWVREGVRRNLIGSRPPVAHYIADGAPAPCDSWGWKNKALPAIHMPFGMCRHELRLETVTVERLQDISEADAIDEGVVKTPSDFPSWDWRWPGGNTVFPSARDAYFAGWEWLHGPESVARNPWLWKLAFEPKVLR